MPSKQVEPTVEEEYMSDVEEPVKKQAKQGDVATEEAPPRLSRQEQKELAMQRKLNKPHAGLIQQCKRYWEIIRTIKTPADKRKKAMIELMALIKGKCVEVIFKHDASRIIQSCLKHGNQEQRDVIASELDGHYVEVSKSQYGKFIVSKILQFCPKYRGQVIKAFYGKVQKLIRHKFASAIIEECYSDYANAVQRTSLMEEFYGPEYTVFKSSTARSLKDLLEQNPAKAPSIMRHLKVTLYNMLGKGAVQLGQHTIIHRALLDYMTQLSVMPDVTAQLGTKNQDVETKEATNTPSNLMDLIELLKDHLIHILHTREGSQVTQLCIAYSTPKLRKHIIKSFKSFVKKIALEQYGHAVLISLFECVDDTVFTGKSIFAELFAEGKVGDVGSDSIHLVDLLRDKYASKVVLYLLCGRSRKHLPAFMVSELEALDSVRALTSKKDLQVKQKELLKAALPFIVKGIQDHLDILVRCRVGSGVVVQVIKHVVANVSMEDEVYVLVKQVMDTLCDMCAGTPQVKEEKMEEKEEESEEEDEKEEESEEEDEKEDESEEEEMQEDDDDQVDDDEDEEPVQDKSVTGKPFNAAQKLSEKINTEKQLESGVDVSEHILINRSGTLVLKELISNRKVQDATMKHPSELMVEVLVEKILPHFTFWLNYCLETPSTTSGTAFVLVSLLESNVKSVSKLRKAVSKDVLKSMSSRLNQWRTAEEERVKSSQDANKKRKRNNGGGAAKKLAREQQEQAMGQVKMTGIETLVKVIQSS